MTTPPNQPQPTGYVFLDVDGIINPFDRDLDIEGWTLRPIEGFEVWVGKPLKPWFKNLVAHGVQIVWATTWINTDPGLRRLEKLWGLPIGLPQIDALEWSQGYDYNTSCGKRPGIIRWLNANKIDTDKTPCVWVDDCLGPLDLRWADARGVVGVKVPSEQGLSDPAQLALIEAGLGVSVAA